MTPDDRQRAADKAAQWSTLEGVALGKVEETRAALRRAGAYTAWLEEEWARERLMRIQLEREAALRVASGVHSSLEVGELVERLRDLLQIALERTPEKLEAAIAQMARPEIERAVRGTLAICLRVIPDDADRQHARAAVEQMMEVKDEHG